MKEEGNFIKQRNRNNQAGLLKARIEPRDHASDRIVAGDSILELKILAEPLLSLFAEVFDIFPRLAVADCPAKRQHDDVEQAMLEVAKLTAWIGESFKA